MRLEQGLALGIVLARELVVVPRGAIGLEDEALLGPAEVGDGAAACDEAGNVDVGMDVAPAQDELENDVSSSLRMARGRWR